jgi:hypothetical protein
MIALSLDMTQETIYEIIYFYSYTEEDLTDVSKK